MIIIGSGGHVSVVIDILRKQNKDVVIIDDNRQVGDSVYGIPIVDNTREDCEYVVAVGDNLTRKQIVNRFPNVKWGNVIDPSAIISPSVKLGTGNVICAGAVIQPYTVIGNHNIINTKSSVDHECSIGDFSHLAPGTTLCGNVNVGSNSFIGAGSTIIQKIRVGCNVVVGSHSNVIRDILDNTMGFGNPFKVHRTILSINTYG